MAENFQRLVFRELSLLLEPIIEASKTQKGRANLLLRVGWRPDNLGQERTSAIATALNVLSGDYETKLLPLLTNPPQSLDDLPAALEAAEAVVDSVIALSNAVTDPDKPPELEALGEDLLGLSIVEYFRNRGPALEPLFVLLTLLRERNIPAVTDSTGRKFLREPQQIVSFEPGRVIDLITDPIGTLEEEYFLENGLTSPDQTADKLFPRLANLGQALGLPVFYGFDPLDGVNLGTPFGNARAQHMLTLFLPIQADVIDTSGGVGIGVALDDDLGLVVHPIGTLSFQAVVGRWAFKLDTGANLPAFAIGPSGLLLPPDSGVSDIRVHLGITKLPAVEAGGQTVPAFLIGSETGTRLELQQIRFAFDAAFAGASRDFGVLLEATGGALIIESDDGDGFLAKVFPKSSRIEFDLGVGFSNNRGIYFKGSGGLEVALPVNVDVAGVLTVSAINLAIAAKDTGELGAEVTATASVKIGPVTATVERLGVQTTLFPAGSAAHPQPSGNLGPYQADLGFRFPSGIGIGIDSGPVAGGGFLFIDSDAGRYRGALALRIYEISLSAFGVIDTKLPDGGQGFSFAIIISARFTPIPLGFGFTLNGVGGMLGINRTVEVGLLQDAVRNHTLDHVLFPEEPEKNFLAILQDLSAFFPAAEGRYTFGPLAIIGWGGGTVLIMEAELGIILELPEPIRLVLLGQVKVGLPDLKNRFVKLNFDVVGALDFAKKTFSLDASMYDSQIGGFDLSGDMALRLNWGDQPNFVLSIGGFHPLYRAPAGFPKLRRVTVALANNGTPSITISGYLAVTSNTFQIGAKAEILANKGSFNVYGWIGFDALIIFQPFGFRADFSAGVALRKGTRHWASIHLSGSLSGPNPWHASGEACLSLFLFDICVGFDVELSKRKPQQIEPLPPILDKVIPELEAPRSWSTEPAAAAHQIVSLVDGAAAEDRPLLDPLGAALVKQRIVPLELKLDTFEHVALGKKDPRKFRIKTITVGEGAAGVPLPSVPVVRDYFARGQFQKLSDAAKLALPGFELMTAGAKVGSDTIASGGMAAGTTDYETFIIDGPDVTRTGEDYTPDGALTSRLARRSALALGGLQAHGPEKYRGAVVATTSLGHERYTIATVAGLAARDDLVAAAEQRLGSISKGAAQDILAAHLQSNPNDRGKFQVVARLELPNAA